MSPNPSTLCSASGAPCSPIQCWLPVEPTACIDHPDPRLAERCTDQVAEVAYLHALQGEAVQARAMAEVCLQRGRNKAPWARRDDAANSLAALAEAHLAGALALAELKQEVVAGPTVGAGQLLDLVDATAVALRLLLPLHSGRPCPAKDHVRLVQCALAVLKLLYRRQAAELTRALLLLETLTGCLMPLEPLHFRRDAGALADHWAYWDFEIGKLICRRQGRLADYYTAHERRLHLFLRVEAPTGELSQSWDREAAKFSRGLSLLETLTPSPQACTTRGSHA